MSITRTLLRFARCQSGVSMVEFALVLMVGAAIASAIARVSDFLAVLSEIL